MKIITKKEKLLYLNKVTARISHKDSSSGKKAEFLSRFRESGKCMGKKPGKIGIFEVVKPGIREMYGKKPGKNRHFSRSSNRENREFSKFLEQTYAWAKSSVVQDRKGKDKKITSCKNFNFLDFFSIFFRNEKKNTRKVKIVERRERHTKKLHTHMFTEFFR